MPSLDDNKRHTQSEVWGSIHDLKSELSDFRAEMAGIKTTQETQGQLLHSINAKLNQPPPPTNWIGYVMLALGMLGMYGAYSVLITSPISKATELNAAASAGNARDISSLRSNITGANTDLAWQRDSIASLEDDMGSTRDGLSRLEGRHEMLINQIDRIDNNGSRRWNDSRRSGDN